MTATALSANHLLQRAAMRYRRVSVGAYVFATFKLRTDPVYAEIIRQGALPPRGLILDLGCGQALALSVIRAAQALHREWGLPETWPKPPDDLELQGFEVRSRQVRIATKAMSEEAQIHLSDLRTAILPRCSGVLIFDALHYLPSTDQDALLEKIGRALDDGGTILIREADARGGLGFDCVRVSERLRSVFRGKLEQGFHYRSAEEWSDSVSRLDFETTVQKMNGRAPFSNVLIRGVRK